MASFPNTSPHSSSALVKISVEYAMFGSLVDKLSIILSFLSLSSSSSLLSIKLLLLSLLLLVLLVIKYPCTASSCCLFSAEISFHHHLLWNHSMPMILKLLIRWMSLNAPHSYCFLWLSLLNAFMYSRNSLPSPSPLRTSRSTVITMVMCGACWIPMWSSRLAKASRKRNSAFAFLLLACSLTKYDHKVEPLVFLLW